MNEAATLSVEEATDREGSWVEEAISYSVGRGHVLRGLDRWLLNPLIQRGVSYKGGKAFRRSQVILEQAHAESSQGSGQEDHDGA